MQIVFNGGNMHDMPDPFSGKNITNLSSAELAQRVVRVNNSSEGYGTP